MSGFEGCQEWNLLKNYYYILLPLLLLYMTYMVYWFLIYINLLFSNLAKLSMLVVSPLQIVLYYRFLTLKIDILVAFKVINFHDFLL